MRLQAVSICLVIVVCSCNNIKSKQDVLLSVDTAHKSSKKNPTKETIKIKVDTIQATNNRFNEILGIWILKGDKNPTFKIGKSTIYYPEQFKSFSYKVIGDSIKIFYEDFNETFQFKLKGRDTLSLSGEDGVTEYYKADK